MTLSNTVNWLRIKCLGTLGQNKLIVGLSNSDPWANKFEQLKFNIWPLTKDIYLQKKKNWAKEPRIEAKVERSRSERRRRQEAIASPSWRTQKARRRIQEERRRTQKERKGF